jgi:hypothetical protein
MPKEKIKPTVRKKKSGGVTPKTPQTGTRQSTLKLPSKPKRGKVILGGLARPKGLPDKKAKGTNAYRSEEKKKTSSVTSDFKRKPKGVTKVTSKGVVKNKPVIKASTKITKVKPKTNTQKLKESTELLNKVKTGQKIQKAFNRAKNKDAKKEEKAGRKLVKVNKKINRRTN